MMLEILMEKMTFSLLTVGLIHVLRYPWEMQLEEDRR